MIGVMLALVALGIGAGPLLAKLRVDWLRRFLGWVVLGVLVLGADRVLRDVGAVGRMVGICCVLLGGMKGLVYAE